MPRPAFPPTPGSSTDMKGKEGPQLGTLQMAFELPPPAMAGTQSGTSSVSEKPSPAPSYRPTSPKSPVVEKKSASTPRRRSTNEKVTTTSSSKDAFTLPPPPTRSRKIIQMKPRGQEEKTGEDLDTVKEEISRGQGTQNKRKQPSATSVAGRKIARKTAHSLIERRRRSKMNEEFDVLKNMIPACTGEMHKLAILQASIDYVNYLEDCVTKLKAQNNRRTPTPSFGSETAHMLPPPATHEPYGGYENEDEDMEGSDAGVSPTYTPLLQARSHSHQPSMSPALLSQESYPGQSSQRNSYPSASNEHRHYSYSASANTSPNFGPQVYEYAMSNTSANSTLTSPALAPQRGNDRDLDHEATAALLMLNTDRRGTNGNGGGRGMSVRDLLST